MANKNFKSGINGLRESKNPIAQNKTPKHTKSTYYLKTENLNKIKAIAYFERKSIGKTIDNALSQYIESFKDINKALELFNADEIV